MYVITGIILIVLGSWLGMERSDDWASILSIWLVVAGTVCMVLG
jgi:hypothetical protein